MEITGSELTTVLTAPARTKSRLISTVPRTPVFRAQVNGAVIVDASTNSITDILYDNVTPGDDYLDILANMTIDIGTTPGGRERGSLRVRGITMGQIAVQETSPGMIDINDNDYITVVDEHLPWLIPVRRVETLNAAGIATDFVEYHDYSQIYLDQNAAIPPKANIVAGVADDGQGYYLVKLADWADAGETYRTVTLSAVASQIRAYSATFALYLWDIGDCTLVSGTLSSTEITIEVPVGFRYVRLLVGDSNGKGHYMYLPLWTHDDSYPPLSDFKVTGDDTEDGRSMRFEFYGADSSAAATVLPRNSTIYYWKSTTFGREAAAPPRQYRHGALLWILSDATPLKHKRRGTYALTAGGAADWMKSVYGFPQTILNPGDTPDVWYEMQHITGSRLINYVLTAYTTLPSIVNVFLPALTDEIENFNTKAGTVWSQLVDIAKRCGYQTIGCDSQSGLWMKADYFFLTADERAARSTTLGLTPAMWPLDDPPVIPDEQTEDTGQVVGYGAAFDPTITDGEKNALYGARAPGITHNAGKSRDTAPYQILPITTPAATLARWTGEYFARKNNQRKQVRVKLIPNLDVIEPCWNEPISITDTRGNLRGLVLNGDLFIVKKVSIRHNYEPRRPAEEITLTLEGVTTGNGGISFYIPPAATVTSQPYVPYNPPPRPTFMGQYGLSGLLDRIACFDNASKLHIVNGLRQMPNGVTPETDTQTLSGSWGTLDAFAVRADSPFYLAGSGYVNGYLAGTSGARPITDIFGTPALGTLYSYAGGSVGATQVQLQTERGNPDFVLVALYKDSTGTRVYRSIDGGGSWSAGSGLPTAYDTNLPNNAVTWKPGLWLLPDGTGEALVSAANTVGSPPGVSLWRTVDSGANWALLMSAAGDYPVACIVKPFLRNDVIFHGVMDFTGSVIEAKLYRIIASTSTDITPSDGSHFYGVGGYSLGGGQRAFSVADDDPNAAILVGYNSQQGKHGVFQTWNALAPTPTWNILVTPGSVAWRGVYYVSHDLAFLIGTSGWIGMLKYASGAWQLYAYQIPGGGTIVGICGG